MNKIQSYTFTKALKEVTKAFKPEYSTTARTIIDLVGNHNGSSREMIEKISKVVGKALRKNEDGGMENRDRKSVELILIKFLCSYILSEKDLTGESYNASILSPFIDDNGEQNES